MALLRAMRRHETARIIRICLMVLLFIDAAIDFAACLLFAIISVSLFFAIFHAFSLRFADFLLLRYHFRHYFIFADYAFAMLLFSSSFFFFADAATLLLIFHDADAYYALL